MDFTEHLFRKHSMNFAQIYWLVSVRQENFQIVRNIKIFADSKNIIKFSKLEALIA